VHLRIYKARPEVTAIVHAHPVSATAVGCANQEMLTWGVPEAVVSLGPGVPLAGLALPGSDIFWAELDPLLPHYDAVMVGGNGVFSWGKSIEQAYLRMELVEHLAAIFLASVQLGGPRLLARDQVQALLGKRAEAGLALPADPARPHWF
jgi:L-fuculose-phosphate aldolase